MAQNNQPASFEESTPPTPVYSQPLMTHAPLPPTLAGAPPTHSGVVPPPVPSPETRAPSTSTDGARIVTLEGDITTLRGTINQMAADMAELMALLKGPNRASSNSTPPPGYEPTVDPNPWVPPTHAPEGVEAPTIHAPTCHPANVPPPSVTLSAVIPPPPSDPTTLVPPPMSISVPAPVYVAPPPMVFPVPNLHAPVYTSKPLTFQAPQPHINFSYPAPPPVNIPVSEPNTPTQAAFAAPLTNCLLETEVEQEQRLKKMEENIKALQSGGSRLDAGDGDWILFPGMRLPPKIKVPEFQRYHGTTDPRHHLRHYRGKMLQYWDYEEFVIHTFWDSLAGAALDWYMSLKAADIPT
ncbi:extensin-like [Punica granatum]|uniref:Extensin-like n=1 Tax=Punica granatum TaxID=22663 RepID=A0A6P8DUA9_PUNGR|nr:extensin-like [Punica granatum]